ncbi:PREDICTED: uncharacterized protein LOC109484522 [Branchiostoma belcheri]|uniref:Uncharacterized protein LOC109484522 n=1 Tax=Branchiostoma belcheri TaxID=7741 RepID=A0A6P5AN00_BRABE|nr:PREDICTED: uncharacterized protein LOC109484522 [Branchiostoma belcheri]XP_019643406.1 PREDICTED: uncharacterized protein LOC109484522 [Branchiostoma belcheri]
MKLATVLVAVLGCLLVPEGGEAMPARRSQAKPMTAVNWNEAFEPLRFGRRSPASSLSSEDDSDSDLWPDYTAPQPRFTLPPQREPMARMLLPSLREDPADHLTRSAVLRLLGDLIQARQQQNLLDN